MSLDNLVLNLLEQWSTTWANVDNVDFIKVDHKKFAQEFLSLLKSNYRNLSNFTEDINTATLFEKLYKPKCFFIYPGSESQYSCAQAVSQLDKIAQIFLGFGPYISLGHDIMDPNKLKNYLQARVYESYNPAVYDKPREKLKDEIASYDERMIQKILDNIEQSLKRSNYKIDPIALPEIVIGIYSWLIKRASNLGSWRPNNIPNYANSENAVYSQLSQSFPPELIENYLTVEREKPIGSASDWHEFATTILEQPGGLKDRARRAVLKGYKTSSESTSSLCNELGSEMYRDELYKLARDLGLPVTKSFTKKELCESIAAYASGTL